MLMQDFTPSDLGNSKLLNDFRGRALYDSVDEVTQRTREKNDHVHNLFLERVKIIADNLEAKDTLRYTCHADARHSTTSAPGNS